MLCTFQTLSPALQSTMVMYICVDDFDVGNLILCSTIAGDEPNGDGWLIHLATMLCYSYTTGVCHVVTCINLPQLMHSMHLPLPLRHGKRTGGRQSADHDSTTACTQYHQPHLQPD